MFAISLLSQSVEYDFLVDDFVWVCAIVLGLTENSSVMQYMMVVHICCC